ncbi:MULTISPECIES: ribonuclease P protein component [unclassified Francisella]|uniref:ribonuclease P protein component n=1 Tax=unclassified Francisella TaxID=2610885 RepID=UPI002E3679C8|nr:MULTISPECIES: ribonuclease P protein component [unclassified Francisella]MED7819161.1 ribonuclease P protein component [Francisella sp. 19S2-4]MED7830366.1 ribonuclease P protein component [Francisella sp. 19S2-10]
MHNFCLTKQNILNKSEIKQAFDNVENKLSTLHFTFLLGQRDIKDPGICVILPKKSIKKATKRNLCRRLIKEFFRLNKDSLDQKSLIVLSKKTASQATKEDLWQSIESFYQFLRKSQ